jgi:hypothetical protein
MPLKKGRAAATPKGFSSNVGAERHAGEPQNVALAIAERLKHKALQNANRVKRDYKKYVEVKIPRLKRCPAGGRCRTVPGKRRNKR